MKRMCPICKKELSYSTKAKFVQAEKRNSTCRSCRTTIANRSPNRKIQKQYNPAWKGYNEIPYNWFSQYFERRGKNNKRVGSITIDQVYDLWIKQNKRCALSNVPIGFYDESNKNHTCSIDRIDSLKEYTLDNIQLVHKDVNIMKNKFNNEYFIEMCKKIAIWKEN